MTVGIGRRDVEDVAALLRHAARTEIMPRFRRLAPGAVRAKSGPLDLVTDADEAAERVIEAGIRRIFPKAVILGEEAAAADPALLGCLADAELAFIVDPVDGTMNFASGLPLFGCMAAAVVRGEIVAAWIHDPLGDDTALALRGEGAWIADGEGRRVSDLRVAASVPVAEMIAAVSWGWMPEPMKSHVTARLPRLAGAIALRCAAHEYRLAAGGHVHALIYNKLMPWDHAPGWLLHREAGGYSARFDASPYTALTHAGGLLVAPDRTAWEALHQTFLAEALAA